MVGRKIIAIGVALLCAASVASEASAANILGTANAPTTCRTGHFYAKEGDVYKMARNKCPNAQGQEAISVAATLLDPGSLLVWPAKDDKEPIFRALTYAGIENDKIVLTQDPGPSIRLPLKGIFTQYGILDIAGYRIILDVVYPDKIKANVRYFAKRCKCKAPRPCLCR
jgi:hypothetical protein